MRLSGHPVFMKKRRDFDYYVLLFFCLAFVGWLWEVLLFLLTDHAFINRGVYRGPYLPIYGVGGVLLCFLLRRYRGKPFLVFALSMVVCSVLEYLTSYLLEVRWGIRWWDYRPCLACQWQDLPGRGSGLRSGRDGPGLSAAACV